MISESMINGIFRRIALRFAENGAIQEKYVELYTVAIESAFAMMINIATTLTISYLLGMWWHGVILFAAFIPLRSYAGGYHARGYISCYLESCTLLTAMLLIIKCILQGGKIIPGIWILFVAAIAVVFFLAPLADENKPISEKETVVFKRRTRIILVLEGVISLGLGIGKSQYCYGIIMAVMLSALLLLLYKAREAVLRHRQNE